MELSVLNTKIDDWAIEKEKWETIESFPNYQVSSYGRVKNAITDKELKGDTSTKYKRVRLYGENNNEMLRVHRLVAEYFVRNKHGKKFVNHIDGNKHNNRCDNLEWCTMKENSNHAYDNDLYSNNKKVILVHKMTDEMLFFRSRTKANEFLGVNKNTIFRLFKRGENEIGNYFVFERK